MIEWKQVFDSLCGFVGGKKFFEISASVADYRLSFQGKLVGHYDTVNQAKAKAEELLTEYILTTAIKDLPEDKLAELGVSRKLEWYQIESEDDLSIGESYYYFFEGEKHVSFAEFQGDGFSNENENFEFDELFDFTKIWFMDFEWPTKPIQ